MFGRHPKMDSPDIIVDNDMGLINSGRGGGGAGVKLAPSLLAMKKVIKLYNLHISNFLQLGNTVICTCFNLITGI